MMIKEKIQYLKKVLESCNTEQQTLVAKRWCFDILKQMFLYNEISDHEYRLYVQEFAEIYTRKMIKFLNLKEI